MCGSEPILLYNLSDLFYLFYNLFADDTTPHASGFNQNSVMAATKHDRSFLVEWFRDNHLTLNAENVT